MKKLMFIATAALCGAVLADEGIVSANIVGYAGQELLSEGDQKFVTSQFVNVGDPSSPINLQSITVVEAEQAAEDGMFLSVLGGGGETVGLYKWKDFGDKYGWADMMAGRIYAEGVTFAPGTGLWVQNDAEDALNTQTAGQVPTSDITITMLTEGDQVAGGNPYPVAIDLQDFTVDEAEQAAEDGVFLSILGGGGETVGLYKWKDFGDKYGWADMMAGRVYAEGVTINPGEGVWLQNDSEDALNVTVNLPEALQ